ncbi:MAG: transposase [Oscillospiraceae bacterium]
MEVGAFEEVCVDGVCVEDAVSSGEESDVDFDGDVSDGEGDQAVPCEDDIGESNVHNHAVIPDSWSSSNIVGIEALPFTSYAGVRLDIVPPNASCSDYFNMLWPDTLFELIADQTNLYADQTRSVAEAGGKPHARAWHPTTPEEMKAFFSLNILFGLHRLPRIEMYWSGKVAYRNPFAIGTMSLVRFQQLNRYLHLADSSKAPAKGSPGYDPLYKVRPVLDMCNATFSEHYQPEQALSIDEAMVRFKGRWEHIQYMPCKPTKWGIKVWILAESKSGYCLRFEIYTGKVQTDADRIVRRREYGVGYDVVMNLLTPNYLNKGHHVYIDRFFCSVLLASDLVSKQTCSTSTILLNRKGLPAEAKTCKLKTPGTVVEFQKGPLTLTLFHDKRTVSHLSTEHRIVSSSGSGWCKPFVNLDYNKNMGGVDLCNQNCSYYPPGKEGMKWWRYILWWALNVTLGNAFRIFKLSSVNAPAAVGKVRVKDSLDFRDAVMEELNKCYVRSGNRSRSSTSTGNLASRRHDIVRVEGQQKYCKQCSIKGRKTKTGGYIRTYYMCSSCQTALCKSGCFAEWHSDRNLN